MVTYTQMETAYGYKNPADGSRLYSTRGAGG